MKLIIDIPEDSYERVMNPDKFYRDVDGEKIRWAVYKGTPLPKGHGRMGDLDALRDEVGSWGMNDYEPSDFIDEIDRADTIIEADTESEDKK